MTMSTTLFAKIVSSRQGPMIQGGLRPCLSIMTSRSRSYNLLRLLTPFKSCRQENLIKETLTGQATAVGGRPIYRRTCTAMQVDPSHSGLTTHPLLPVRATSGPVPARSLTRPVRNGADVWSCNSASQLPLELARRLLPRCYLAVISCPRTTHRGDSSARGWRRCHPWWHPLHTLRLNSLFLFCSACFFAV
jgi:hypothetical protein